MRSNWIIAFVVVLAALTLQVTSSTRAQQNAASQSTTWEYKVVIPGKYFSSAEDNKFSETKLASDVESKLNKLGAEGWELSDTPTEIGAGWILDSQATETDIEVTSKRFDTPNSPTTRNPVNLAESLFKR